MMPDVATDVTLTGHRANFLRLPSARGQRTFSDSDGATSVARDAAAPTASEAPATLERRGVSSTECALGLVPFERCAQSI